MKVLVTGGAGFVGSRVAGLLLARGVDVRVLDRRIPSNRRVEWIDGDLRWVGDCDRAVKDCQAVLHLAARISVDESLQYVVEYFADNVLATLNLLNVAKQRGVEKFIYTSTCAVYGNVAKGAAKEDYPCNPSSPYAASKYAAERAVLSFYETYRLPVTILRPFNIFGEGERPVRFGSVIPTFIQQALRGKDLAIHGDGTQVRDYLYVRDVAEAHVAALNASPGEREIFNVCSGIPRTVHDVATQVVKEVGSSSRIVRVPDPRGGAQVTRSVGSNARIRKALSWSPRSDYRENLRRVIGWYRRTLASSTRSSRA